MLDAFGNEIYRNDVIIHIGNSGWKKHGIKCTKYTVVEDNGKYIKVVSLDSLPEGDKPVKKLIREASRVIRVASLSSPITLTMTKEIVKEVVKEPEPITVDYPENPPSWT